MGAVKEITDLRYLVPRLFLWVVLFAVALFDVLWHRQRKRRGYQLQRGIVVCLFVYVASNIFLLAFSILDLQSTKVASQGRESNSAIGVRRAYYVFCTLADSMFMGLLLSISAGYCITRDNLGPYRKTVLLTPIIYFIAETLTLMTLDINNIQEESDNLQTLSTWTWLVLFVAEVVSLMAFMLALVFIFEIVNREVEAISKPREGIVGAPENIPDEAERANQAVGEERPGHDVTLPPQATENGQPLSEVYAEVTGEDHDAPKTVEDRIQHRTKVTLMRQFSWATTACLSCYITALVLSAVFNGNPGQEHTATLVAYIIWDSVLWLFLAGLCFIFRARESNPYLLLDEEEGGLDTDFSSQEINTELGVLSSNADSKAFDEVHGINQNYSLGDDDDEEAQAPRRHSGFPDRPKRKENTD